MRLKNALLVNDDFAALLKKLAEHKIPVSAGLKLLRAYKVLENERNLLIETRNNLIIRYGVPNGQDGYEIPSTDPEAIQAFQRDVAELLDMEFELPEAPIKMSARIFDKNGAEAVFDLNEVAMLSTVIAFED